MGTRMGQQVLLQRLAVALFLAFGLAMTHPVAAEPFTLRGYYLTFMRMPVMGLPEWEQTLDCLAEDEANVVILWTAGGFRSRKFPITWQYNEEHKNVQQDFVRELIEYAHAHNIRVLLGFTPFGYDGVNRYTLEHPELKAQEGRPAGGRVRHPLPGLESVPRASRIAAVHARVHQRNGV